MVLVSLIVGLGLAELLSNVAKLIRDRHSITFYWVHTLFVAIIFLALLQSWWEVWWLNSISTWSFVGLIAMLGGPIGLFVIAHLAFPSVSRNSNLRTYYYSKMSDVFWLALITVILSTSFRPLVFGDEILNVTNLSSAVLVTIFAVLAISKNPRIHGSLAILVLGALLADILLTNLELE